MSNLAMMMGLGSAAKGWAGNLENASYDNVGYETATQALNPRGIAFKPDGTKMYVVCNITDKVFQYSLSTAWDLSTTSYDSVEFYVGGAETQPAGVQFNDDGTLMYVVGYTGDDVNKYSLTTAWIVNTAQIEAQTSISSQLSAPYGFCFNNTGTKMYAAGPINSSTGRIYQYSLSTAWDSETLSYDNKYFEVQLSGGLFISPDGKKMYVADFEWSDSIRQLELSTPYDVSTATEITSFSVSSQGTSPSGIFFDEYGEKMYVSDYGSDSVFQYSTA